MAEYQIWLTDDAGVRIKLLKGYAFCTYSRASQGYGTFHIGIPINLFDVDPLFIPDRRVEIWRSPAPGFVSRREGSYFLRKWNAYTRNDGMTIIEFFGRSPIDILRRQSVSSYTASAYSKTGPADDVMKEIVYENFVSPAQTAPSGEFLVDGDEGQGPTISASFFGDNVLDILDDIRKTTFIKNKADATDKKIYFDVVEGAPLYGGGYGYIFRTYSEYRGTDRTTGVIFSVENGNLDNPSYYEDHLSSYTNVATMNGAASTYNGSAESGDKDLSRWNDSLKIEGTSKEDTTVNNDKAEQILQDNSADKAFNGTFLNSPGSDRQPRSLYGIDWDMGDLVRVQYAGKNFNVEVSIVYVSVDESGKENITGLTKVQ